MQPQPGSQLAGGRYVLESRITRSGMGEVWLAKQQGGGVSKTVVVKMIHPDLNAHREAQQRFFDEAQIVARINHPHVVKFYEFGEQESTLFQVMEYIEGYAFSQIVEHASRCGASIPIPVVCRLMADACQGLGFIHDMADDQGNNLGLVHRDISPQNLLVSNTGTLKIIDFGIVKAKTKTSRTRTGVIVGKLQYMSPEQLSSEELDFRSDIYSLGLVLYELLTLEPRFRGSNLLEIFYEAFNEPPPTIVNLRPDCPPELVSIVQKALAQSSQDRFAHAYDMQDALESLLHAQGTPINQRSISSFMSDLFAGRENVKEETTRIHAASLLSEFQQAMAEVDEETVNFASIDDLGDLDNDPLAGTMISTGNYQSTNETGQHTMASGLSASVETSLPTIPASPSQKRSSHTLQGPAVGHGTVQESSHWGVPRSEQPGHHSPAPPSEVRTPPQTTQTPSPASYKTPFSSAMAPPESPPVSPYITPSPISHGVVSEETVMLSTSDLNVGDSNFLAEESGLPTKMQLAAQRGQQAHEHIPETIPPPTFSQSQEIMTIENSQPHSPPLRQSTGGQAVSRPVATRKRPQKNTKSNNTIWLGLGLGFVAFLLGILIVYFLMGQ